MVLSEDTSTDLEAIQHFIDVLLKKRRASENGDQVTVDESDSFIRLKNSETSEGSSDWTSDAGSSVTYDEEADSEGADFYRGGKQEKGQYIAMMRRPLVIYSRMERRKFLKFSESYKLFRALYSLWKRTGVKQVNLGNLGSLLLSEDPSIFCGASKPKMKTFLQQAINRKFPIEWYDDQSIDFEQMIDVIESKETVDRLAIIMQSDWF